MEVRSAFAQIPSLEERKHVSFKFNPLLLLRVLSPLYLKLTYRLIKDRRVPFSIKLIPVFAVLYVIVPMDLVPDFFVPLISQIDDFFILVLGLNLFLRMAPVQVLQEHLYQIYSGR